MNGHGENTRSMKTGYRYFHWFSLAMKKVRGGITQSGAIIKRGAR